MSLRQGSFSPPGLNKDTDASDLERLFGNLSTGSSSSKPTDTCASCMPGGSCGQGRTFSQVSPNDAATLSQRAFKYRKTSRRGSRNLSRTVPLTPSNADVFYDSPNLLSPDMPTTSTPIRPAKFRAAQYFQLRKDGEEFPAWTLPPVPSKPKKARL